MIIKFSVQLVKNSGLLCKHRFPANFGLDPLLLLLQYSLLTEGTTTLARRGCAWPFQAYMKTDRQTGKLANIYT